MGPAAHVLPQGRPPGRGARFLWVVLRRASARARVVRFLWAVLHEEEEQQQEEGGGPLPSAGCPFLGPIGLECSRDLSNLSPCAGGWEGGGRRMQDEKEKEEEEEEGVGEKEEEVKEEGGGVPSGGPRRSWEAQQASSGHKRPQEAPGGSCGSNLKWFAHYSYRLPLSSPQRS